MTSSDERTPKQRQQDWGGRFQPIYAVREEDITPDDPLIGPLPPEIDQPTPAPPSSRGRWQGRLLLVGRRAAYVLVGLMLIYLIIPPPPLDILILGVDARPGEGNITRTDSIMVLGVQPRRMRLSLLSIPRDLFINVPGYGSQRINTVNMLGEMDEAGTGPALLSEGIANSFGIQPDRYARLNFDGFVQLIDAVGGVRVNVAKTIVDPQYPTADYGTTSIRFEAGRQHMTGEEALIYARTRYNDDDYGRAERQQQVLSALARRLANPIHWPGALVVINRNVDTNMSPLDMVLYAPPMVLGGSNINRLVIDREYILPGTNGAIPNYEKLAPWLEPRFD
jgi:LCP family protein required for cell wall assembly